MPVAIPRGGGGLLYHSVPLILQFITLYSSYNYNLHEFVDRTTMSQGRQDNRELFDFVIVGGGTSGSVLANRLSASGQFKVLLLEAGSEPAFYSKIPLFSTFLFGKIQEDWKYKTVPQKNSCFGLANNVMPWPCGKGLGGSSILNSMIYVRGTVQGFDTVAGMTGDPIWRMENVLRYYQKVEDYHGHFDDGSHSKSGPLSVDKSYLSPYISNFEAAFHELGYKTVDPNVQGPVREGVSPMDLHIRFGRRWSAYDGYIRPIMNQRPNLAIRKFSYVYRVLFADDGVTAVGVEYSRHGTVKRAYASKEVVLSAGAVQSPKILMLSGIGPREHLDSEPVQIPVRVDLPVGENLQDKYGAYVGPFVINDGTGTRLNETFRGTNYANWLFTGGGSIAASGVDASYAYKTKVTSEGASGSSPSPPDIHTYILSVPVDDYVNDRLLSESVGFNKSLTRTLLGPVAGRETFWQLVNVAKPDSVGTIRLQDANPFSPPVIDPNYFSERRDLDRVVEGIKFGMRLAEGTEAMRSVGAKLHPEPYPGCETIVPSRSDEYWACVARQTTGTAYKYGGTVPIGNGKPPNKNGGDSDSEYDGVSVVDVRLRVHGVRNLRVVDGSVLQERYVSVNMVTCAMLGELASEFILEEHQQNQEENHDDELISKSEPKSTFDALP